MVSSSASYFLDLEKEEQMQNHVKNLLKARSWFCSEFTWSLYAIAASEPRIRPTTPTEIYVGVMTSQLRGNAPYL